MNHSIRNAVLSFSLAAVALLAGCTSPSDVEASPTDIEPTETAGVSPTPAPSPEPTEPSPEPTQLSPQPPEPSPKPTFDEAGYLANLSHDPFLKKYSDDALLLLAGAACNAMPGARDLEPARFAVGSIVTDPDSVNLVVWTAIPMKCPEYEPLVEADLDQLLN